MKINITISKNAVYSVVIVLFLGLSACAQPDGAAIYQQYCATCHGADLNGGNSGSLIDGIWQFGAADNYRFRNIKFGITHMGMPSYGAVLKDNEINAVIKSVLITIGNSNFRKKWLFWFCEGSACVSGKTKCAICAVAFSCLCLFVNLLTVIVF